MHNIWWICPYNFSIKLQLGPSRYPRIKGGILIFSVSLLQILYVSGWDNALHTDQRAAPD